MISLREALYTKSPIDLERKRIIDEGSIELGRSIVQNYGKDAFSTSILESIMEEDPTLMREFRSYGGFKILKEDKSEYGGGIGGFFRKVGDKAKGAMSAIELGVRSLKTAIGFNKKNEELLADYKKMLAKYEGAQEINLKKLDDLIKNSIPNFPNNGPGDTEKVKFKDLGYEGDTKEITPYGVFIIGLGRIAGMYDSVVASHEKDDGITTDQANIIIDDLRAMCVSYSAAHKEGLSGSYTAFAESSNKTSLMRMLYEADPNVAASQDSLRGQSAEGADLAQTAAVKRRQAFPKVIKALGIGTAALGILQQMDFFQNWVKNTFSEDAIKRYKSEEDVPAPDFPAGDDTLPAFSYQLQHALRSKGLNLDTNAMVNMTQAQAMQHCKDLGWVDGSGNLTDGILQLHAKSGLGGDMVDAWNKTIKAVGPDTPMGGPKGFWGVKMNPLFGGPTPAKINRALGFIHGPIAQTMKQAVIKTETVPGGGGLTTIGRLLAGTGQVNLIAAGVALWTLGKAWEALLDNSLKESRLAAFQALKNAMVRVNPKTSETNPTPPPAPPPAPPPVPVPPEAKGPSKVAVYLTGEKTMIGWDDPHDLLAPLTEGTIECDDKDNIKPDTNEAAVVMRARQILIKYFVCKPQRIKPSESSGLKTNDFAAFPKKLMELDVVVVRLGEDGKAETETVPGETPPEIPDEVVDEEMKKKEEKKKKGSSTAPGAGRLVRVDLSSKKGKGGDKGAAPAMAAEGAGMRMSDFLFEDAEVRKLGKDADAELKKKWQTLTDKAKVEKIAVPKDVAMFPTKEDPFFAKHKIDKKSGTGIALDTLGAATVSRGIRGIRNKVGSGNVVLGFDNSTAAEFESIGYGKYLRQILSIYSADPNKAPTFDDFISKMKEKKIPTVKNQDKLKDILTRIGMISTAKASKGGAGTPETKKESFDRTEDDAILERWQSLAGLLQD